MRYPTAIAAGLLLAAATAQAGELTGTVTAVSDYDFRGVSLSEKDPALQASIDYAHDSGFYLGAWGSNIDFEPADGDIEIDFYGGYTGEINDKTSWTAGAVWYSYPGSDNIQEYAEIYAGVDSGPLSFKQWYSPDLYDLGDSAWYSEGNATIELPQNFSLLLHLGYSWGDAWDNGTVSTDSLLDYSLGLGYALEQFSITLKYTGTDANVNQEITTDVGNNEGRLVFLIATTLPWGAE